MLRSYFVLFLLLSARLSLWADDLAGPVAAGGKLTISVEGDAAVEKMEFTVAVPGTIPGRQEIASLEMSPKPTRQFKQDGNSYAVFTLKAPIKKKKIVVEVKGKLFSGGIDAVKSGANLRWMETSGSLETWLKAEKWLEVNDPVIQKTAAKLKGRTPVQTLSNIQDFISKNMMKGGFNGDDVGAVKALAAGRGDCTDFSDVMMALCRAAGIPARVTSGYLIYIPDDTPKHDRMEVYLDDLGWVRVDPFHVKLGHCTLSQTKPNLFVVDHLRTNDTLGGYHFWRYLFWGKGNVKVSSTWTVDGKSSAPSKAVTGK